MSSLDLDAVRARYRVERDKRMVEGRAAIRDLTGDGRFAGYRADPFTPFVEREPISDDVEVAVVGAGLAGVLAGAKLRQAGAGRIRLIDRAGGIGGTWYWNRYPGVMCDVESYIYLPMLEELDYIPTTRYAFGPEIRAHLQAIADRYELSADAVFHTGVEAAVWDEAASRWVVRTDRGDEITAKYLVMAVGILNLMKLPAIPGMERFAGRSFHTARWDYDYTGGGPDGRLDGLGDKVVGILGTGASAIQCIPPLADSAKRLFVFQRTPSAIGVRGNRPTEPDFVDRTHPGWQRERMDNFQAVMNARPVDADLTDDGWTHHMAKVYNPPFDPQLPLEENMRRAETIDYAIMEEHRSRIDDLVTDPRTAEILKPHYRYLCKRPCFHDEYLPSFNSPNVTLVDCPAGIDRVTETGVVVAGTEYALDCLIYATGFEAEVTPFIRRANFDLTGRNGVSLAAKWENGMASLHGMMTHDFPNLFIMPAPGQQGVVTTNHTHISVEGAEHLAATYAGLKKRGVEVFDVTAAAEADWTGQIVAGFVDRSSVMSACTPSRLNFEGNPSAAIPANGSYGGGLGNFWEFRELLANWIDDGALPGSTSSTPLMPRGRPAGDGGGRSSGRRGHRRSSRHRRGHRRGPGTRGCLCRHDGPGRLARRSHQGRGAADDDCAAHRRRRRVGAGLRGLRHRPDRCPRPVRRASARARLARCRRERCRHQPADQLCRRRGGGLGGGARGAPQRLPQRAGRGVAHHGRGRSRPGRWRHLWVRVAGGGHRRIRVRQAGGSRADVAARAVGAARGHGQCAVADRGDANGHGGKTQAVHGWPAG
jgi:cation diffusion facilitator CzcD-associated flavoprotein CzcO